MRITVDARFWGWRQTGGIGRYLQELLPVVFEMAPQHAWTVIVREPIPEWDTRIVQVQADIPWYGFREQWEMSRVIATTNPDLVHIPHWNVPLQLQGPFVVTIHDLLLRKFPASAQASTRSWPMRSLKYFGYRVVSDAAMRRASNILVPTQAVADEVEGILPTMASKIWISGEGMPEVDAQWSVPQHPPYLLVVGSAYPHKRLDLLWKVWPRIQSVFPDLRLVHVGREDVFLDRLKKKTNPGLRVEYRGLLSDAELQDCYRQALGFLYPSAAEGFGLPPLEALARSCPVIASNIPVHREVLGDAPLAWLGSEASWIDVILETVHRLRRDEGQLRQQALDSARNLSMIHSWKRAARTTVACYESVASRH